MRQMKQLGFCVCASARIRDLSQCISHQLSNGELSDTKRKTNTVSKKGRQRIVCENKSKEWREKSHTRDNKSNFTHQTNTKNSNAIVLHCVCVQNICCNGNENLRLKQNTREVGFVNRRRAAQRLHYDEINAVQFYGIWCVSTEHTSHTEGNIIKTTQKQRRIKKYQTGLTNAYNNTRDFKKICSQYVLKRAVEYHRCLCYF